MYVHVLYMYDVLTCTSIQIYRYLYTDTDTIYMCRYMYYIHIQKLHVI